MTGFDDVEAVIRRGLDDTAPAIALAVYYRGEFVVERAYGYFDPDTHQRPILPSTLFDLASVTKLYTTTAFLMQVADGAVSLDDPVARILPEISEDSLRPIDGGQNPHTLERELPDADTSQQVNPATITFRQLLTHTSGLAPWRDLFANVGPTPPPPGHLDAVSRHERVARALKLIASYPFVDAPGNRVRYSDLGLILLGEAVARLDGVESPDRTIRNRVTAPAGFVMTTFNPPSPARCAATELDLRWRGRRCQGEVHDENARALGGIAGHAGLFGTAAEVAAFGLRWLHAVKGENADWLPVDLAREAVRDQTGGECRGLGWALKPASGDSSAGAFFSVASFGHTGYTGTSLWIDPHRELVVAVLTNRVYWGRGEEAIAAFRPALHDAVCRWVDGMETLPKTQFCWTLGVLNL